MFDQYDDLLEVHEACALLHMSRNSIYTILRSGELKGYQHGRRWRIPKQAVIEYIKKRSGLK